MSYPNTVSDPEIQILSKLYLELGEEKNQIVTDSYLDLVDKEQYNFARRKLRGFIYRHTGKHIQQERW
jgi:hypothetical protein